MAENPFGLVLSDIPSTLNCKRANQPTHSRRKEIKDSSMALGKRTEIVRIDY
jgi:hypothetical protein